MRKYHVDVALSNQQIEKEFRRSVLKSKRWSSFKHLISVLIVTSAILVLLTSFLFPVYQVTGNAMEPALNKGMIVVANRLRMPEAGDIAAMYWGNRVMIRRVIGLPGDQIDRDGLDRLYINGVLQTEPYLTKPAFGPTDLTYPYLVPENHYFVLGDNRDRSADSRTSDIGCIDAHDFAGKIIFCIWPVDRFGHIG